MDTFSVRDFLKAVEVLKHGDTGYPELAAWIRCIRASVEPACLNAPLYGAEGPCPEWPYVCSECNSRKNKYHPAPVTPEIVTVEDFLRELESLAEQKHMPELSDYLVKIRRIVAPECLESGFFSAQPPECPEWPFVCGGACQPRPTDTHADQITFGDFLIALRRFVQEHHWAQVLEYIDNFSAWLSPDCRGLPFTLKASRRPCPEWPRVCGAAC